MSNLPVDPYNRGYIVEPPIDNPDRAPLGGTGKDFVVTLSDNTETPGSDMMFLSRSGKWVPFKTTDLVTWGSIAGDITEQADLMAMFAQYTPTTGYARVAFTGNYNDLLNKPPLGTVSPLDLDGSTSRFLRGDGTWQIPVDVNAQWGNISGNINAQTDLITLLNLKAPITNPTFQGLVNIPTPPVDDNSTLAINSAWFFGQAFNGTPQMDGVASSGNATLWARGNHRHPTDTTKIGDAPNDGQQYARQSQTWTVVAPPAGGGGGVWIGDTPPTDTTKYPFWWSSTSLQLSIWYNDGNSSQWVDTNAAPSSPPGAWLLQDGTVTAPGLAWASEAGLGWYRKGTSQIGMAAKGVAVGLLNASAVNTDFQLYPSVAGGGSYITMTNAPISSANFNSLQILNVPTGYNIAEALVGTATAKPLNLNFPAGIVNNVPVVQQNSIAGSDCYYVLNKQPGATQNVLWGKMNNLNRWAVLLGGNAAEAAGNFGSDFGILSYDNTGAYNFNSIQISRSNGIVMLPQAPAIRVRTNAAAPVGTVIFNLADWNRGNCYNPANGRFTAPVPGSYRFHWQHLIAGVNGVGEYRIGMTVNGSVIITSIHNVSAGLYETIQVSSVMNLNIGDYVTCQFASGPGSLYPDPGFNQFDGEFIG